MSFYFLAHTHILLSPKKFLPSTSHPRITIKLSSFLVLIVTTLLVTQAQFLGNAFVDTLNTAVSVGTGLYPAVSPTASLLPFPALTTGNLRNSSPLQPSSTTQCINLARQLCGDRICEGCIGDERIAVTWGLQYSQTL